MLHARMRTLLNESLPPGFDADREFSFPGKFRQLQRNFSENAGLVTTEANFTEVGADGLDGLVIATSGAIAGPASSAPECGLTTSATGIEPFNESPTV